MIQEISSKKHSLYGNVSEFECFNQVKFFLRSFISNLELIEKGSSSKKLNLQDCSLVHCIYAGAFIFYKRNIEFASLEIEKLFNLTGSVLPTSLENKKLVGMRRNGEMLYSEAEIVELRSNVSIDRVFLLDDYPKREYFKNLSTSQKKAYLQNHETYVESSSRSKFAIKSADIIIYSAGTQHSSLYPTYLTRGLARAISDNKNALKIFITNIGADYETPKYKAHNYIEGAYKYLCLSESRNFKISEFFSHILINKSSRQKKVNYVKILSKPLRTFPFKVIIDDFEDNLQPGKHDGSKLVKKIISIYKNSK